MGARLYRDDILFVQRILAVSGFYRGPLNGKWNTEVDAAERAFNKEYERIKSDRATGKPGANVRFLFEDDKRRA